MTDVASESGGFNWMPAVLNHLRYPLLPVHLEGGGRPVAGDLRRCHLLLPHSSRQERQQEGAGAVPDP